MILALSLGGSDRDPAQTKSLLESALSRVVSAGDTVVYLDQPLTLSDAVPDVARSLGLVLDPRTPRFDVYGLGALEYTLIDLISGADVGLCVENDLGSSGVDKTFYSLTEFYGLPTNTEVIHYERIEVL